MDLATIEMPVEQAKERLEQYRKRLGVERTRQDERIAAGYRVLARGLPIIKLSESVQRGGYFDNGLPRIAIARADSQDCWVDVSSWEKAAVYLTERPHGSWGQDRNRGALVNSVSVRVNLPDMPELPYMGRQRQGHTIMPLIPPQHRPNPRRLHHFHILWEVEQWALVPPRDPALLRWIGGDLWAVSAVWDLTELERAVLQR